MIPVRVGVVGVGSMGYNHARVYSGLPQADLVGVSDLNAERVAMVAEEFDTKAYVSYEDLFDKVQAVSIVAPTAIHFKLAMDFLQHGIHVLVEKPIAVDVSQAKQMVDYASEHNLVLQVGHLERFNPAVQEMCKIVNRPVLVECHRLSGPTKRNLDVGITWDLMIHDFDILISMLKSPVAAVSAYGTSVYSDFEDVASVQLRFKNGVMASLVASRNSGERTRVLKVTEESGRVLMMDFIEQSLSVHRPGPDGRPLPPEVIDIRKEEPLRCELCNFIDCINTHKTPEVSGEDGKRALELAMMVLARMKTIKAGQE